MIAQLMNPIGWRRLTNLILLLIVFGTLGWGLTSVIHGLDRGIISIIMLLCIGLVMLLSYFHITNRLAATIISLGGLIGSVLHFASLATPLRAILRSMGSIPETLLISHSWPDLTPLELAWQQLVGQLGTLFNRIGTWLAALLQGQYRFDAVAASFTWGLVFWLVTAWATWAIFRLRRPLPAIAPAGALLAGALNYANGQAVILLPFVAAALLLMALNRYDAEEHYWQQNHIDIAEDIRLDMITWIPLLVIGLIILATFTPPISIQHITRLVYKLTEPYQSQAETLAESLGINHGPASSSVLESLRSPGLPQQHLLGSGTELSKQVIMTIQTGDLPPVPSEEMLPHPPERYYWRSITYDVYTGRGWATSPTESIQYKAGQPAVMDLPAENPSVRVVEQSVKFTQEDPVVLYASGLLLSVDSDYEVYWRVPIDGTADMYGATTQERQYNASSLLLTPSIEELRASPLVYPQWVTQRYLTLPENLPQRVRRLAIDLTQGQPTSYDQATAIETYLKSYPYTLDVPAPPPGKDVVDYFIYDLQKGYCDYYASAMVVLSRAAGIPARLVSGYASGIYDPANARYVVTADNAHSWVEVYFSGIGWVEFEPTGGFSAISRREEQTGSSFSSIEPKPVQHFNLLRFIKHVPWLYWFGGLICLVIAILSIRFIFITWRLNRKSSQALLAYIYIHMIEQGDRLAVDRQPGDTPLQYSSRLLDKFNYLASRRYLHVIFSPALDRINHLIMLYIKGIYSPHPLSSTEHKQAVRNWIQLHWKLRVARLWKRKG